MRKRLYLALGVLLFGPPEPTEGVKVAARFCPRCQREWPAAFKYKRCAFCEVETHYRADKAGMTEESAQLLIADLQSCEQGLAADWAAAEAVANTHGLDVADMIVAKRRHA